MLKIVSFSSFLLLLLPFSLLHSCTAQNGVASRDLWCVARNSAADDALQAAINWACGPGGANCGPIQPGGTCYNPDDIVIMASWAFNDYYLKNGLTDDACVFSNTAALTSLNPSHGSCKFPSSLSVSNGGIGNTTTAVGNGPGSAAGLSDMNDCNKITGTWFGPLLTGFLLVLLTVFNGFH